MRMEASMGDDALKILAASCKLHVVLYVGRDICLQKIDICANVVQAFGAEEGVKFHAGLSCAQANREKLKL